MANITKLDKLYSLREDFSVIGITGRIGSGCSSISEILSTDFSQLNNTTIPTDHPQTIRERKYEIVHKFNTLNWKKYRTIKYRNVLLLILSKDVRYQSFKSHLLNYYKISTRHDPNHELVDKINKKLYHVFKKHKDIVLKIKEFGDLKDIKGRKKLKNLADFFYGDFQSFAEEIDEVLLNDNKSIVERTLLLQHTAKNFRRSGQAYNTSTTDYDNIYYIAEVINKIIKGTKILDNQTCHVTINSLRNSLEINFFKERYSGFYLIAVKSDERKKRLVERYQDDDEANINNLLSIDENEYKCNDFVSGHFFSPDVQNCIQKADFHIITRKNEISKNDFYSTEQQLLKLQGLIQQPGLITPSTVERSMQFAFNAKLNSGCISRQVGAVITDAFFSVKSIGWNDVPSGTVPCAIRNIKDLANDKPFGFSDFELGEGLSEKTTNQDDREHQNPDNNEIDIESKDFNKFIKEQYTSLNLKDESLGGINCPYCFKTAYNKFKGENNQVHTRSLHAEENAMMQISKHGGQPLKKGFLFTTASPCELCSKKAYQLGITDIYYIDPYPGISRSHILRNKLVSDPNLHMFYGAIGRGFLKLYEAFMSQKDEIGILTNFKLESPQNVKVKSLKSILSSEFEGRKELIEKLDIVLGKNPNAFDDFIKIVEKGLENSSLE
jgi:deoxycytidylate deaminase